MPSISPIESTSKAKAKAKAGISSFFILASFSRVCRCCLRSRFSSCSARGSASKPKLVMVSRILRLLIAAGSNTATPVSAARLTCMARTPSRPETTFSMRAEHEAQVIPLMARSRVNSLFGISSSNPRPATCPPISSRESFASSHSTSMVSAAKLTTTALIPSWAESTLSMRAEHDAQVIPLTASVFFCISAIFFYSNRIVTALYVLQL